MSTGKDPVLLATSTTRSRSLHDSPDPYPPSVPPPTVGVIRTQQTDLHAIGGAVDEAPVAHVESNMGDCPTPVRESEQISRHQSVQPATHFLSLSRLIQASPWQSDAVLPVGVLNQS